jgi:hypothetical protein
MDSRWTAYASTINCALASDHDANSAGASVTCAFEKSRTFICRATRRHEIVPRNAAFAHSSVRVSLSCLRLNLRFHEGEDGLVQVLADLPVIAKREGVIYMIRFHNGKG